LERLSESFVGWVPGLRPLRRKLALASSYRDGHRGHHRKGSASAIFSSSVGWCENLAVAGTETLGACGFRKVPVLGRDGGLEDAKTRLESKTKLLWNERAIRSGDGVGGSDGKKRLMSSSFAKCSRGQYDHPIFTACEDVERRLPDFAIDLHTVSRLPQTGLIAFATYVLR
jgi:hypothetical protein